MLATGVVIALPCAWMLRRPVESQLFGVDALDPLTFATVPLLLGAVAWLASYLPVRRAMQIDPMTALRQD